MQKKIYDSESSEKIFIRQAKAGDISAFKILIKQNEKKILNTAMWFLGNKDDAFDVVQEVFLYAFKNINKFREESSFYTWLNWILLDMVKRKRTKDKIYNKFIKPIFSIINGEDEKELEDTESLIFRENKNKDENPLNILEKEEKAKKILNIIKSLDEKYSAPIILCDLENLTYKEASLILNCAETTLKIRLFRARLKLKEKLSKDKGIADFIKN